MRTTVALMVTAGLLGATGCAPSRDELFAPVREDARARLGVAPEWRSVGRASAQVSEQVDALLAEPLDADAAARIAVLNSPRLQAEYARLEAARARLLGARTPPNPEVEAELRFPVDGGGGAEVELGAMIPLTDLLTLGTASSAAGAELRARQRRAVAATLRVAAQGRMAYLRAAAAEARLAVRRGVAEAAAASAQLAEELRRAGNVTEFDRLLEAALAEDTAVAVRAAEAEAAAARADLAATLGLHGRRAELRLAAELPAVPPDLDPRPLEEASVAASEALAAARLELEAAGARVGLARFRSVLPGLAVGVSAERDEGWGVGPAVALEVPLFDWGQGERAEAWAEVRRLQQAYAAQALDVRAAARRTEARLVAAHARARRLREVVVPLRRRLLARGVLQYNAMNLSPFELLILRRDLFEAELRLVEATADFWVAHAGAEALRGGALLDDDGRGVEAGLERSLDRGDHR